MIESTAGRTSTRSPGRMTSVMRAMPTAAGPKILRVGVVEAGRVVDERLVKNRTHVTVGPSEQATFMVAKAIPSAHRLFELDGDRYRLNLLTGMTARLAPGDRADAIRELQGTCSVPLGDDARGKVSIGDTTLLFQLVRQPPAQARPQLPMSVRKGVAGDVDWFTTVVAAFSFLLHFFAVALVYSDWMDPVMDDSYALVQVVEAAKAFTAPPALDRPIAESEAAAEGTAEASAPSPGSDRPGARRGRAAGQSGRSRGLASGGADSRAAELGDALAALNVATLAALDGGTATAGVFEGNNAPTALLDAAARSRIGARAGGPGGLKLSDGAGSDAVKPGAGRGDLRNASNTRRGGENAEDAGTARPVEGPKGGVRVSPPSVTGKVPNAGAVVAGMRSRFRHCYQRGLDSNPMLQGSVTLLAKIGPNGEVLSVSGGGGGLSMIVPCLKATVRSGAFAPPKGTSTALVQINITFHRIE